MWNNTVYCDVSPRHCVTFINVAPTSAEEMNITPESFVVIHMNVWKPVVATLSILSLWRPKLTYIHPALSDKIWFSFLMCVYSIFFIHSVSSLALIHGDRAVRLGSSSDLPPSLLAVVINHSSPPQEHLLSFFLFFFFVLKPRLR